MTDDEYRLYCFAKQIWPIRSKRAPLKERFGEVKRFCTWAEVFQLRTGQSLEDYQRKQASPAHRHRTDGGAGEDLEKV